MKRWPFLLFLLCVGALPASADNCSGLSDCMNQPRVWALIIAAIVLGFLLAPLLAEIGIASLLRILGRMALRRLINIGGRTLGRLGRELKQVRSKWHNSSFEKLDDTIAYHWKKHGEGNSLTQYTKDAENLFANNKGLGKPINLRDGTTGIKIKLGKGKPFGIYTSDGKIISFGYR